MASRLSRRVLAQHVAERLMAGDAIVLSQLAAYLVETSRTAEADLLVRDIETALSERGLVVADVATAYTIDAATETQLRNFIAQVTNAKTVQLRHETDGSLVAGVRVRTPDAELDASVRRQLKKLQAMKV